MDFGKQTSAKASDDLDWEDSSSDTPVLDTELRPSSEHGTKYQGIEEVAAAEESSSIEVVPVTKAEQDSNGLVGKEKQRRAIVKTRKEGKEGKERRERKSTSKMRQSRSTDDFKDLSTLQPLSRRTVARAALEADQSHAQPTHTHTRSAGNTQSIGRSSALDWTQALSSLTAFEPPAPSVPELASAPQPGSGTASTSPSPRPPLSPVAPERNKIRALFSSMVIGFKGATSSNSDSSARAAPLFGTSLDELALRWRTAPDQLPPPISALIAALLAPAALQIEGIFRVSAAVADVNELRLAAERGAYTEAYATASPHTLSGLLAAFLLELPEPLMPFALYDDAMAVAALPEGTARTHALASVLQRQGAGAGHVPAGALMRQLTQLLQAVERHSASNKMAASNLAVVFGPLLLRPRTNTLDMKKIYLQNSFVEAIVRCSPDEIFPRVSFVPANVSAASPLSNQSAPPPISISVSAPPSSSPLPAAAQRSLSGPPAAAAAARPSPPVRVIEQS